MTIRTTGSSRVDTATAEIAVALRDASPGKPDQACYDEAMRLRNEIMLGTRQLDGLAPPSPHDEHTAEGPDDCRRCQMIRDNADWLEPGQEPAGAPQEDVLVRGASREELLDAMGRVRLRALQQARRMTVGELRMVLQERGFSYQARAQDKGKIAMMYAIDEERRSSWGRELHRRQEQQLARKGPGRS